MKELNLEIRGMPQRLRSGGVEQFHGWVQLLKRGGVGLQGQVVWLGVSHGGLEQRHSNCCQFVRIMSQLEPILSHCLILMDHTLSLIAGVGLQSTPHLPPPTSTHCSSSHVLKPEAAVTSLPPSLPFYPYNFSGERSSQSSYFLGVDNPSHGCNLHQCPLFEGMRFGGFHLWTFARYLSRLHVREDKGHPQAYHIYIHTLTRRDLNTE